mgnify:CR=1 FL=1|tara:strand:+ start:1953 stop:2117 length:165 start_codon:yes stop_codon:yes gene_type:complete
MEAVEQMMMQVWLGGLLGRLKEGKVAECIKELETALERIETDGADATDTKEAVT